MSLDIIFLPDPEDEFISDGKCTCCGQSIESTDIPKICEFCIPYFYRNKIEDQYNPVQLPSPHDEDDNYDEEE